MMREVEQDAESKPQANDAESKPQANDAESKPQANIEKTFNLSNASDVVSLIRDESEETIKKHLAKHIHQIINKHNLSSQRVILLYDEVYLINPLHSNKIYEAVSSLNKAADILMVLVSDGGKIEPAYLISKTCKRLAKSKFVVSIPRRAKSAATLIALGASEIHMGFLSELGPIDPQFGGFPALGLANALEKIASLSTKFPGSAEMFAKYLTTNLSIRDFRDFMRFCAKAPSCVTVADVVSYQAHLRQNFKASSESQKLASILSFFKFLKAGKVIAENPAELIEGPRAEPKFKERSLSEDQVLAMIEAAKPSPRDALFIRLLYVTAGCVSEVLALTWARFMPADDGGCRVRITGKAKRNREVYIPGALWADLELLRDGTGPSASLFAINRHQAWEIV